MKQQTHYFSYFLVLISHNIFISGFIYANQNSLHPIETNLLRGIATFIINFLLVKYYKLGMQYKVSINHKYLLIRSTSIFIHSLTLALCGFYLPQPVIHTINCCGPIFVVIQDYFLNGIKINSVQLKGIIFTFIGIFFTINGDYFTKIWFNNSNSENKISQLDQNNTRFQNYVTQNSTQKLMMGVLFTFIGWVWAYGTIIVKKITELNSIHINLHFGIVLIIGSGLLYPIFVHQPKPFLTMVYGVFFCGTPIAIGNIIYVHALTINKNHGLLTLCISSGVFVGYLISIFRYQESINFICLLGSICIVIGLVVALTGKSKQPNQNQNAKKQENLLINPQREKELQDTKYIQLQRMNKN